MNKTKFFLLNKQDPSKTELYRNPSSLASFMLGRRLSNYAVIVETASGETALIADLPCDVMALESKLKEYL